jgi:hypothetical protein
MAAGPGVGPKEPSMTFFLVASGASLTIGIGLGCLIVTLRDAFKRDQQPEPILLPELRRGGREGRHRRSSHP